MKPNTSKPNTSESPDLYEIKKGIWIDLKRMHLPESLPHSNEPPSTYDNNPGDIPKYRNSLEARR